MFRKLHRTPFSGEGCCSLIYYVNMPQTTNNVAVTIIGFASQGPYVLTLTGLSAQDLRGWPMPRSVSRSHFRHTTAQCCVFKALWVLCGTESNWARRPSVQTHPLSTHQVTVTPPPRGPSLQALGGVICDRTVVWEVLVMTSSTSTA